MNEGLKPKTSCGSIKTKMYGWCLTLATLYIKYDIDIKLKITKKMKNFHFLKYDKV